MVGEMLNEDEDERGRKGNEPNDSNVKLDNKFQTTLKYGRWYIDFSS